ncbi:bifunctional DNA-formamidopyrimidine glycosylase/DNA-(apurinic or apyrimidinic site) lyase [Marinibactrum halimedae]|uniref:Formamidopyrimidine-DNA glycosylase n=1 Tax=Marinibactrum halimedae TaxID=1444977 RepID=A0AA37WMA9_9GAMM|nr:bifunctional DNA-formamidopyrimidine glycosylase/DNA-(apurinic or apyrimidinic site) lyase [Marinibactrum halimedae]MCD9458233.1 bifunctional DNA-formamidopyrimidine glycosylase/DNA-(apurinic or apyrimidinic site) lyase [Marinibactrum halimedae]GLS27139.1 formamidopyrimidine-DNA glycosylase [Marinibactrum halimedae]
MPELPEVETTRRGIAPHVVGEHIVDVIVRNPSLRWPIPAELPDRLKGQVVRSLARRGKYLLMGFDVGTALWHLGMSGSMRIIRNNEAPAKHDHIDVQFKNGSLLRFNDPRRFGALLWTEDDPFTHELIAHLGPEPLTDCFDVDYLFSMCRKRTQAIKTFLMDSKVVVGVGNIYANEALFAAGIKPTKAAGRVTYAQCERLIPQIKKILQRSIDQGGTTLRDFVGGDGKPGYFKQQLLVYGRAGEPCKTCDKPLKEVRLGQRSTVYCTRCQI